MPDEPITPAAEETTEVVEEETPKEEVVEKKPIPETVTDEHRAAINLLNALKNPETASQTIRSLAGFAGLEIATKREQIELKKTISQLITEGLGEDNSILAEKLGPTLEKIIADAVEERVKPITEGISETQKNEFATRIDVAFSSLETESKGLSKKLENDMVKLMEDISPGPNTKPEAYIHHIYTLAKSQYDEAERIKAQDTKRDSNKKTLSVQTGVNPERIKSGSRLPTIRESVEAAMRGETLE
jgi:hypothetical protein